MKSYKPIIIDGIILLVVSTIFVTLVDQAFQFIPGATDENNPIVTAISQASALGEETGKNKSAAVTTLLQKSPELINQKDIHGTTPLMRASFINFYDYNSVISIDEKRHPYVLMLLDKGAQVNDRDEDDWNALCWASWSGMVKITEALVKAGSEINIIDKQGNTPLCIAALRGNPEIVSILLKHGANRQTVAKNGLNALGFAKREHARYLANFSPDANLDLPATEKANTAANDNMSYYDLKNHIIRLEKTIALLKAR
ncbi:MAG: ankyrin repeat domain-containing protein [Akkermansia sp.]